MRCPKSRRPSRNKSKRSTAFEQANVAQAAFGMLTGDFDSLSNTAWKPHEKDIDAAKARLLPLTHRALASLGQRVQLLVLRVDRHSRVDPDAVQRIHRQLFHLLSADSARVLPAAGGERIKAKDGFFPPQSVWLGNIVLAIAGIWLLTPRESSL